MSVGRYLDATHWCGQVMALFERVCLLRVQEDRSDGEPGGRFVSLVVPEIGNGPINIVLERRVRWTELVGVGSPFRFDQGRLRHEGVEIDFRDAAAWNPCPDWSVIKRERARIAARIPQVLDVAHRADRPGLLALSAKPPMRALPALFRGHTEERHLSSDYLPISRAGILLIQNGWPSDTQMISAGASQLAGLGPGLTPSGDDFLAGLMLRSWLDLEAPEPVCAAILQGARPRTTSLSAAFLSRAAQGECNLAWHDFLNALLAGTDTALEQATRQVLAFGSTSGADTLAGFVSVGSQATRF